MATPSSLTSHGPGYIDRDNEVIVGLQTDKPFRRAIMPTGGWGMIENGLKAIGREPDPAVRETFTKYRKTHNAAVFDMYTPEIRACRRSHIITGLPDAYGRGRIIGDYRRVALYGVDRLIEAKKAERAEIDARWPSEDVMRLREEMADQLRALADLKTMAASYGCDIGKPAANAREAVQWTYFGYLGAIKEMNGAAMSVGRISTFLDIYIERDLAEKTLTEAEAQELIDQLVIKLRIVRFMRTPEYDALFSGDPYWATESIGGMALDGRTLVTRSSFRMLQTLTNLGPAPEPNLTVLWSKNLPEPFKRQCIESSRDTSSLQYENDDLMLPKFGDDYGIACCVSAMRLGKQMQYFGARVNLAKCLLYAINGGRDEMSGVQVGPAYRPVTGDVLDYEDVMAKFDDMMDWLARTYVHAMNCIHYSHDRYNYERLMMALHDRDIVRTMAFGIAGLSVVADSLSAIKYAKVKPIRDEKRPRRRLRDDGRIPGVRQQRSAGGRHRGRPGEALHGLPAAAPDLSRRDPHAVGADHHFQRRLRQGHRQHAGRPAQGRALRPRREPDARSRLARLARVVPVGRAPAVRRGGGRHQLHAFGRAGGQPPGRGGGDHAGRHAHWTRTSGRAGST